MFWKKLFLLCKYWIITRKKAAMDTVFYLVPLQPFKPERHRCEISDLNSSLHRLQNDQIDKLKTTIIEGKTKKMFPRHSLSNPNKCRVHCWKAKVLNFWRVGTHKGRASVIRNSVPLWNNDNYKSCQYTTSMVEFVRFCR